MLLKDELSNIYNCEEWNPAFRGKAISVLDWLEIASGPALAMTIFRSCT